MLNKICELSAEIGKATLILESKDEQIKNMQEHITGQDKQINELQAQLRVMQNQMVNAGKDKPHPRATLEGEAVTG